MRRDRVLALIMAGGKGSRLEVLTETRTKPAIPYAGVYRLVDFPLTNCMHSGISDVWLVQQYQPHSLNEHVSNGRPWDLDRTHGGLRLLPPHLGRTEKRWHRGNADAVYHNRELIRQFDPSAVLILSSDHVYKLDYSTVIAEHCERGGDATIVTTEVPRHEAGRLGVVTVDDAGRVTGFENKPDTPSTNLVSTEAYVFRTIPLLDLLDDLAARAEDDSLADFGNDVLPALVDDGRAQEYRHKGYWRDVGTIESYWRSHMELLEPHPELVLDDPTWPIRTLGEQRPPALIHAGAEVETSLISTGCIVHGRVVNSVLAPGVVVEEAAEIRDSVVLHDARIAPKASVACAILDMNVGVGAGAVVGSEVRANDGALDCSSDDIVVAGQGSSIKDAARIERGDRLSPNSIRQ